MQETASGPDLLMILGVAGALVLTGVFVFSFLLLRKSKD